MPFEVFFIAGLYWATTVALVLWLRTKATGAKKTD